MLNPTTPYQLMLVLQDDVLINDWIALAKTLLPEDGEVHLRGLVAMPEGVSLSEGTLHARRWRDSFGQAALEDPQINDDVRIHVDYRPMALVMDELQVVRADLLLVQWNGPNDLTGGITTDDILKHAPCDTVLVSGEMWHVRGDVLLSLRGGPNLSLGFQVARALAGDESITLFHAADLRHDAPDLQIMMRAEPHIKRAVTAVSDIREGILREARGHKAIVLGASFRTLAPDASTGAASSMTPMTAQIAAETTTPLVLVRAWNLETLDFHAPRRRRMQEDLSTRVDRWFAQSTFDHHEYEDLPSLMQLKERHGLTISVALPALNEEATIRNVIMTLRTALMDDLPLIDELVLIDSESSDRTVEIAQECGLPVYVHPAIMPEVGTYRGKGEALWKSLHVLKGDIVAWVDTDIVNIHPRFIYGLIGPLLKHPHIQYVKGFYRRPIQIGDKLQAVGGGRVTELVARPLFNLFYPELSGIIQPLSGEYAGRRSALEQVPFFSGYGVETGLLIDLHDRFGLEGIAQSDLEVRTHHNQPLENLSKMSFAILQVFIARLEGRYGVQLLEKANRSMKTILQEPERLMLEIAQIGDFERPPMVTLPAYRERYTVSG
jgi:glucosyl-3-phosphoglycerate synthase